ncbi:hypothetical protein SOVF_134560 [Spinacia oleracea]|nr:hypothetical protein SOVF_134560 [Spinacia oleracea]
MEEDELFIDLISKSENLRDVLDLAKDMKEVGNDFFKQESIEDALEKYGYAGIILGCFQFDEDVDRLEFFDMGKCILLNSAACFSKKMEYGMDQTNGQVLGHEKECIVAKRRVEYDGGPGVNIKGVDKGLSVMDNKCVLQCGSVKEEVLKHTVVHVGKDDMMEEVASVSNFENSKMVEPKYRFVNRRRSGSSMSISKKDYQLLLRGKSVQYFNSKIGSPMTIKVVGSGQGRTMKRDCESEGVILAKSLTVNMSKNNPIVGGKNEEPQKQRNENLNMDVTYNLVDAKAGDLESEAASTITDNHHQVKVASEPMGEVCFKSTSSLKQDVKHKLGARSRQQADRCLEKKTKRKHPVRRTVTSISHTHPVVCRYNDGKKRKIAAPLSEKFQRPRKKCFTASFCNNVESPMSQISYVESCASIIESCTSSIEYYRMSYASKVEGVSHEMVGDQK